MTIDSIYGLFLTCDGITTDTRNLKNEAMFFALKGANFNGNEFAAKAIQEGCKYAIVDEEEYKASDEIILVENVLQTLQQLANHHRKQFDIPVIGITGSNGKTTTKELAGAVISQKYNLLVTKGNLNNHLGVPFTLLELNADHEVAIVEMGANKPGDIKELVEIAEPTHGIISNVGAAHIEGFGSFQGVINTKTEMYAFIAKVNGTLFVNAEDEILMGRLPKVTNSFTYGQNKGAIRGELVRQDPFVNFKWGMEGYESPVLSTNLVGKYNFINFLSAIAIGHFFEVEPVQINMAIENYIPSNNRSQVTKTKRNTLVVDCYNANPTSMMAALESFVQMEGGVKTCILGDMLELGDISDQEHQNIVDFLEENEMEGILIGEEMSKTNTVLRKYPSWKALTEKVSLEEWKERIVLLKGSRGIRLEELIPFL